MQRDRLSNLFHDHEIFVRTGGHVRFLKISAAAQKRVARVTAAVLGVWLLGTVVMLGWQAHSAWQNRDVLARQAAVERAEARVAAQRGRVAATANELDSRLNYLETAVERLGADGAEAVAAATNDAAGNGDAPAAAAPAAGTGDDLTRLRRMMSRQGALVHRLTRVAQLRATRAEGALRTVGLTASELASGGQGGPYEPFRTSSDVPSGRAFHDLAVAIARMEALEGLVLAVPAIKPADALRLSSGFGYRRDPFNGGGAMHAGIDFTGATGSPIQAAARGRISFAGRQSGYGNTVEIDHGHGIMTRYAHLSRIDVRLGDSVHAGQAIAGMGSTGRSTGTHLHFEVRVNGSAVNPRRFLEATTDVLEIQATAGQRTAARRPRNANTGSL